MREKRKIYNSKTLSDHRSNLGSSTLNSQMCVFVFGWMLSGSALPVSLRYVERRGVFLTLCKQYINFCVFVFEYYLTEHCPGPSELRGGVECDGAPLLLMFVRLTAAAPSPRWNKAGRPEYNLFIEFSLCPTLTSDWPVSLRCATNAQSLIWNVDSLSRSKYQTLFALLSKVDWWNENPPFMGIQLYSCAWRNSKPRSNTDSNMLLFFLHLESLLFTVCDIWKIKWAVSTFALCLLYLGGGGVWKGCKIHLAASP